MATEPNEWEFPNRATLPGSPAYYAVRFSPPAQRRRNALLLAWYENIEEIVDRPVDVGVARLKLDWWQSEIGALGQRHSHHPLTTALQDEGLGNASATEHMAAIIDAVMRHRLRSPQPADSAALATACRDGFGRLFALIAEIDGGDSEPEANAAAGTYCAIVERVRRLACEAHRLPPELQPDALQQLSAAERAQRLDALITGLQPNNAQIDALADLPKRLTALRAALHYKIRRKGYAVLDNLIDRPPIAHLWTAWRCR